MYLALKLRKGFAITFMTGASPFILLAMVDTPSPISYHFMMIGQDATKARGIIEVMQRTKQDRMLD